MPTATLERILPESRIDSIAGTLSRRTPSQLVPDAARNPYRRYRATTRVGSLPITDSGLDDGYPYIELRDGPTVYGFRTPPEYQAFYDALPDEDATNLVPEAYFLAEQWYLSVERGHFPREVRYEIQPGDVVVDVGPHHGYYTHELAEKVGPEGHVIAVEAHPENYRVLNRTVEANGLTNVSTVNKAVADTSGTIAFYERGTPSGKHHTVAQAKHGWVDRDEYTEHTVESGTLDGILSDEGFSPDGVAFASLTVNEAELEVLHGMDATLAEGVEVAAVATSDLTEKRELLEEYGYHVSKRDGYYVSPILYASPPN